MVKGREGRLRYNDNEQNKKEKEEEEEMKRIGKER